jgi:hypothetical protein
MRKPLLFAVGLIFVVASVCVAQEAAPAPAPAAKPKPAMSKAQVQGKIIAMEKKLWEAWKNKDMKPFRTNVWSGGVMIGEGGVQNKEAMLKDLSSMSCDVRSYSLSDLKLTWLDSDVAVLTYKAAQDATCGGTTVPAVVWASSVFVRRGGRWYAATHQETPAK